MTTRIRRIHLAVGVLLAAACAGSTGSSAGAPAPSAPQSTRDTTSLIPAGFGSLRQEEISITLNINGLVIRAMPLDDSFIRTLSPDSYRSLLGQRESRRASVDSIARRMGLQSVDLWYVTFYSEQPGEARYSPRDVILVNQAREYRPIEVLALTPGFAENRVRQQQRHVAVYVFDGALDPNQPVRLSFSGQTGGDWQSVLLKVEAERASVRARAGAGRRN